MKPSTVKIVDRASAVEAIKRLGGRSRQQWNVTPALLQLVQTAPDIHLL